MDTLTHGLVGLAVGAIRRPDARPGDRLSPTDRAVLLGCVIAAELPDLDYLWPAGDPVLRTLRAHRGISHSLVAAPLVGLAAAAIVKLIWRRARFGPVWSMCTLAVVVGHLLPDLWTGWGTRLLLPFSDARHALDWTLVIDPLFTLPLLLGAILAWRRRAAWRRWVAAGAIVAAAYLGARIGIREVLTARVAAAHPAAERVAVFPGWLGVTTWRYVATYPGEWAAGVAPLRGPPREQARHPRPAAEPLGSALAAVPAVQEALAWARFPVVAEEPLADGGARARIADLRYHVGGAPTLTFVLEVAPDGALRPPLLERGGSGRELLRRWREQR